MYEKDAPRRASFLLFRRGDVAGVLPDVRLRRRPSRISAAAQLKSFGMLVLALDTRHVAVENRQVNQYGEADVQRLLELPRAWDDDAARRHFLVTSSRASVSVLPVVGWALLDWLSIRGSRSTNFLGQWDMIVLAVNQAVLIVLLLVCVVQVNRQIETYRLLRRHPWRLETIDCDRASAIGFSFNYLLASDSELLIVADQSSETLLPVGRQTLLVVGDFRDTVLISDAESRATSIAMNVTTKRVPFFRLLTRYRRMVIMSQARAIDFLDDTSAGRETIERRWLVPQSWFVAGVLAMALWAALVAIGPAIMSAYLGESAIHGTLVVEKWRDVYKAPNQYDGTFTSDDGTVTEYVKNLELQASFVVGSKITVIKSDDRFYPAYINQSVLVIVGGIGALSLTIAVGVLVVGGIRDHRRLGALAFARERAQVVDRPYDSNNYPNE